MLTHKQQNYLPSIALDTCYLTELDYFKYIVKKMDNVPSQLFLILQWPHCNSCTLAGEVWLHIAGANEPNSDQTNQT